VWLGFDGRFTRVTEYLFDSREQVIVQDGLFDFVELEMMDMRAVAGSLGIREELSQPVRCVIKTTLSLFRNKSVSNSTVLF
jgi:hypothetical protein